MWKRSWMTALTTDLPREDSESTRLSWSSCCTALSIGFVTSLATSSALAPGYGVMISASLIVNSGSSSRPIFLIGHEPADEDEEHSHEDNTVIADGEFAGVHG